MAYYTAAYQPISDWAHDAPIAYQNEDGFEVRQTTSRYYLIKSGYKIAELIEQDVLIKKFKGNFELWIDSIRKKDIQKIETLKGYIDQINVDIELIRSIWNER
jgi:hypothetical protein